MHYTLLRVQLPFVTHKYYNSLLLLLLLFSSQSPDRLCTYYRTSSRLPDHIPPGLVVVGAPPYTCSRRVSNPTANPAAIVTIIMIVLTHMSYYYPYGIYYNHAETVRIFRVLFSVYNFIRTSTSL